MRRHQLLVLDADALVTLAFVEQVVLATVQEAIVPWAGACWVYNAATGSLLINPAPGRKPAVTIRFDMETTDSDYQKDRVKPPLWQGLPLLGRRPTVHSSTQTAVASFSTHQTLSSEVRLDAATTAASAAFEANFEGRQLVGTGGCLAVDALH